MDAGDVVFAVFTLLVPWVPIIVWGPRVLRWLRHRAFLREQERMAFAGIAAASRTQAIPHLDPHEAPHVVYPKLRWIGIPVAVVGVAVAIGIIAGGFGLEGLPALNLGVARSLIPLAIVAAAALWLDTIDPEPPEALIFAAVWGGGWAICLGMLAGLVPADATASAVVWAPIFEELAKGVCVLFLVLLMRDRIDGPVDGIVYAMWVAAGFAYTENIGYIGATAGGAFFVRGILSPFAHVLFTACIGWAAAYGLVRTKSVGGAIGWWCVGLVPAIGLHSLWNFLMSAPSIEFAWAYFAVEVPIFIGFVATVLWLRRRQRDRIEPIRRQQLLDTMQRPAAPPVPSAQQHPLPPWEQPSPPPETKRWD